LQTERRAPDPGQVLLGQLSPWRLVDVAAASNGVCETEGGHVSCFLPAAPELFILQPRHNEIVRAHPAGLSIALQILGLVRDCV
jgi:hypothetical protein